MTLTARARVTAVAVASAVARAAVKTSFSRAATTASSPGGQWAQPGRLGMQWFD